MSAFRSPQEFRAVMDRAFALMSDDPEVGPRLRDLGASQRFEFPDLGLAVHLRPGRDDEPNLVWEWAQEPPWEARVRLAMSSEVANRFFQGRENIAIGIARRHIRAAGDLRAAVSILPITKPVFARYHEMIAREYPHLSC